MANIEEEVFGASCLSGVRERPCCRPIHRHPHLHHLISPVLAVEESSRKTEAKGQISWAGSLGFLAAPCTDEVPLSPRFG